MGSRSRPRRSRRHTVKVARKAKGSARAAKRRPARTKPVRRSVQIKAPGTLVSTEWLAAQLARSQSGRPGQRLRVLDGTWHMPQLQRDPRREFEEAHIPGAAFFDIDAIADRTTSLPHMLPGAAQFSRQVGELGISNSDLVVVYDVRGVVSAARVWWTLRAMGHDRVAVLDGGLRKWRAEGRPVETGPAKVAPGRFRARRRRGIVRDLEQIRRNIDNPREQTLDARSRGRFAGTEPEPRAGLRGGHIPGSLNLPYDALYRPDGTLLPPDGLRQAFAASGVDPTRPVATTCGSGITASVLALGLHLIGHKKVAVYDGSWTEWAGHPDTPVEL
jgi:thiosulfate/3-mercaptopyruvate sulfurtransferase